MKDEKVYWIMKNGVKVDVDQMTESHLRNVLKMLIRNNTNRIIDTVENENPKYYAND